MELWTYFPLINHALTCKSYYTDGPFISNITQHQNIVEGHNLEVTPIVDANPVAKLIWWTRQNDANFIYVGSVLRINNITRMYSGNYSCYVLNTFTPSGMDEINSTSQNMFYVNVVCKYMYVQNSPSQFRLIFPV